MSNPLWIRWLDMADAGDEGASGAGLGSDMTDLLGGKGANLARLVGLGLPVPPGFVITTWAYRDFMAANDLGELAAAAPSSLPERFKQAPMPGSLAAVILASYKQLGAAVVAVRSSGTAEDLAAASFAGQHDTFLNISGPDALLVAVRACWASLWMPRAVAYRREHGWDNATPDASPLALAVVVQRMVPAEAAGVAFTANPLTGDRTEMTISAVRGLGERLVSGEGSADEWVVRGAGIGSEVTCRRDAAHALTPEQTVAIATTAREIEKHLGGPQDVEWAIDASGKLFVLQARPMTALPEPVTWNSPNRRGWMRNFRLGEWLPEPVTPLCESWLLARIEEGEVAAEQRDFGLRPRPPYHVLAHGWYFSSPIGGGVPLRGVVTALARHPRQIAALALSTSRPDLAARVFIARIARRWREDLLPHYQRLVASSEAHIENASLAALVAMVDEVASVAGAFLWDFSVSGGHAWKAEHALARFCRKHLPERIGRSHQELLLGLSAEVPSPYPAAPAHAVQSLDWIRPTLGESLALGNANASASPELLVRRARLVEERRAAEAACRKVLSSQPVQLRRFNALLALAQRYAVLREEQAWWFTLGWPLMRRAVLRLGTALRQRSVLDRVEDVFFLTREELESHLGAAQARSHSDQAAGSLRALVDARRGEWDRQRRLSPPLVLGNPLGERVIARATHAMRASPVKSERLRGAAAQTVLIGMPASPGRAMGLVRVVRGLEDFERFQPGEVLVAQVTTPAWTPLFDRAAAVVTDGGSLAAHASLVAREYGIPAVVGTGDATVRLGDGQQVTVDGSAGIVTLAE